MVETDHDMRNSADFISLDRVARALIRLQRCGHGARHDPTVGPRRWSTPAFPTCSPRRAAATASSCRSTGSRTPTPTSRRISRRTPSRCCAERSSSSRRSPTRCTRRLSPIADLQKVSEDVRDDVANLDDFFRPIKSYFYWEKHCYDIPICWTFRSVFDTIDQIDKLAEDINYARISIEEVDKTFPKIIAQLKATADDTEALQAKLVNSYGSADLQSLQTEQTFDDSINVGNDFDKSRSDDFFYIPHEGFDNEDVKTGMKLMMSPDGKAARFIVTHEGDAMGPEGVEHVENVPRGDQDDLERDLAGRRAGLHRRLGRPTIRTSRQYATSDLLIAAIAAFVLIFLIMMFITRSLVAALVIPGTVAFSYAGAFGLVHSSVAAPHRSAPALACSTADVHHPGGGRVGLQPAADQPRQGRASRRNTYRSDPRARQHRRCGDVGRYGVRVHHVGHAHQRSANDRSGRLHRLHRPASRHADRAFVRRAVHPCHTGTVVLVANTGAFPPTTSSAGAQHRSYQFPCGEVTLEIANRQERHRLSRPGCCTADVREQHHVV